MTNEGTSHQRLPDPQGGEGRLSLGTQAGNPRSASEFPQHGQRWVSELTAVKGTHSATPPVATHRERGHVRSGSETAFSLTARMAIHSLPSRSLRPPLTKFSLTAVSVRSLGLNTALHTNRPWGPRRPSWKSPGRLSLGITGPREGSRGRRALIQPGTAVWWRGACSSGHQELGADPEEGARLAKKIVKPISKEMAGRTEDV